MRDAEDSVSEGLWRFSLALYARPGVAAALIALQDRLGRDVNLMLYALWLGATQGRRLQARDLADAEAAVAPLAAGIVAPLRQLRRRLKEAPESDLQALRRRLLALEIAAERQVQARLAAMPAPEERTAAGAARLAAAEANLARYLGDAGCGPEASLVLAALRALICRS